MAIRDAKVFHCYTKLHRAVALPALEEPWLVTHVEIAKQEPQRDLVGPIAGFGDGAVS